MMLEIYQWGFLKCLDMIKEAMISESMPTMYQFAVPWAIVNHPPDIKLWPGEK